MTKTDLEKLFTEHIIIDPNTGQPSGITYEQALELYYNL